MTKLHVWSRPILLIGGGLLLAACGGAAAPASSAPASAAVKASAAASPAASVKPAASLAASASAKPAASAAASAKPAASGPVIGTAFSFEAQDFTFNGPATIQGGLVTLQFKNTGKEPHHLQLLKLNTGVTMDQLTSAIATQGEEAVFRLVSFQGGVGTIDPNGNAEVALNLPEGQYVIACFISGADGVPHLAKGMIKPLNVTAPASSAAPSVQAAQTVTMKDFTYDGPTTLNAGRVIVRADNSGPQVHEMNVIKLAPGKTVQDAVNFFKLVAAPPAGGASAKPAASGAAAKPAASAAAGTSAKPAASAAAGGASAKPAASGAAAVGGPPPFTDVGGLQAFSQNGSGWAILNLEPGEYAFVCNVPDPSSGQPHTALGMAKQISVK